MVSNDDILGLRERRLVGVEGMEEADDVEYPGKLSLYLELSMIEGGYPDDGLPENWLADG